MRPAVSYGLTVFACVAFVGWITGMGGSMLPNLGFSALMGLLAFALYGIVKRKFGPGQEE